MSAKVFYPSISEGTINFNKALENSKKEFQGYCGKVWRNLTHFPLNVMDEISKTSREFSRFADAFVRLHHDSYSKDAFVNLSKRFYNVIVASPIRWIALPLSILFPPAKPFAEGIRFAIEQNNTIITPSRRLLSQVDPKHDEEITERVQSASEKLRIELIKNIQYEDPYSNFCVSPTSIFILLGMVVRGISGVESKEKILKTLGLEGMQEADLHRAIGLSIKKLFSEQKEYTLTCANAAINVGALMEDINDQFLADIHEHYQGAAFAAKKEVIKEVVNQWVSQKTGGQISEFLDDADIENLDAMLINALNFQGKWMNCFDTDETKPRDFHCMDGSKKTVSAMVQKGETFKSCVHEENEYVFKSFRSPKGVYLELMLCKPVKKEDYETWFSTQLEKLSKGGICAASTFSHQKKDDTLTMPKMSLNTSLDLIPLLKGIGIDLEHQECSDFTEKGLITDVKHQIKFTADEEGAKAAAVTSAAVAKCLSFGKDYDFMSPFIFAVMKDGEILFQGTVKDASALELATS